jgi:thymidylate synthase
MNFKTTHEAYLAALREVLEHPDFSPSPRGLPIYEKLNFTFTVDEPSSEPIVTRDEQRNEIIADYTRKEFDMYNSGETHVELWGQISKFWTKIANPDGHINSAYGYLIWRDFSCGNPAFEADQLGMISCQEDLLVIQKLNEEFMRTPWEWAVQALKRDKDTRQAVLKFHKRQHLWFGNKDQVCTMHGIFFIRGNRLHFTVVMRSNDLVKGLVYDMPWFSSLMDTMLDELKPTYPDLAKGSYTHMAHSSHIYDKDVPTVLKMIGKA